MVRIPRPAIRAFVRVLRRVIGPSRDPPVTLTTTTHDVSLRCVLDDIFFCRASKPKKGLGEVTVLFSLLNALAHPGTDNVVFQPTGPKVEILEWGRVTATVASTPEPVPLVPAARYLASPGPGFARTLAEAGRFADRVVLCCSRGEIIARQETRIFTRGGFRLPGDRDLVVPACPAFAAPDVKHRPGLMVGLAPGHFVVNAGPWTVALAAKELGDAPAES